MHEVTLYEFDTTAWLVDMKSRIVIIIFRDMSYSFPN